LQNGDEIFTEWSEVEKYAVPRSLFSESDHIDVEDDDNSMSQLEEQT